MGVKGTGRSVSSASQPWTGQLAAGWRYSTPIFDEPAVPARDVGVIATAGYLAIGLVGLLVSATVLAYSTRRRIRYGIAWGFVCVVAFTVLVAVSA